MNTPSIKELLHNVPLFKDLTDEEITPIVDIAQTRSYQQGTHVFMQGDPLTNVYFIHKGHVKIYKTDLQGREQIVNVLKEGDMFPHHGFFRQDAYPAHAQVTENVILLYIPINQFENVLLSHPAICVKLFKVLGDLLVDLQNRLKEQMLNNTYEQIILLLLRLSKKYGHLLDNEMVKLTASFTNRELANMIGSSRETVSRTINQLKKQGMLVSDDTGSFIINKNALEEELFLFE